LCSSSKGAEGVLASVSVDAEKRGEKQKKMKKMKGKNAKKKCRGRALVLMREGKTSRVSLEDIKTVTSSPQGTIKVMGMQSIYGFS
jgi:hypothetical protein